MRIEEVAIYTPFPARAGMNRQIWQKGQDSNPVPRARGDEPEARAIQAGLADRSPRARG